jgi:hypothetical protein
MKPISDNELRLALEGLRPEPRPAFTAELDARAAAGFPRDSRAPGFASAALLDWLRSLKPRQVLLPAGAAAMTLLLVAGVIVSQSGSSDVVLSGRDSTIAEMAAPGSSGGASSDVAPVSKANQTSAAESAGESSAGFETEAETVEPSADSAEAVSGVERDSGTLEDRLGSKRAIERSSEITLGTEPEQVGKASSEVFDVVHDYRGVVLSSRTSDGSAAHAEAKFELLIPSGKLSDAMAGFSQIAEVRSRHEATNDITAPTVSATEHLEDSRARIDSLLGQLADAETEGEREAVERELREERGRAAALQASLDNLERRASLSRVSLRIVGGEGISTDEGGAWGIGDAFDDAGQILGVAAAVTLLALAVLGPIALIALLIWLGRRTYLRRARRTALG